MLALGVYTASFIGEIVRSGIMAVSHGQTEAARALGLRSGAVLRLVVLPQALRVIIPPLASEYLNITKNTSLAVAIGYADLVAVGNNVLNPTGQSIEVVAIWMAFYLGLSIVISLAMNWFNARIALTER
jgi:general L-amino acid transport system permease protein